MYMSGSEGRKYKSWNNEKYGIEIQNDGWVLNPDQETAAEPLWFLIHTRLEHKPAWVVFSDKSFLQNWIKWLIVSPVCTIVCTGPHFRSLQTGPGFALDHGKKTSGKNQQLFWSLQARTVVYIFSLLFCSFCPVTDVKMEMSRFRTFFISVASIHSAKSPRLFPSDLQLGPRNLSAVTKSHFLRRNHSQTPSLEAV